MSSDTNVPEHIRLAADQHGLGKALELFPDSVKAGYERGTRPVGAAPKGNSPIASPAHIFNPARFEQAK